MTRETPQAAKRSWTIWIVLACLSIVFLGGLAILLPIIVEYREDAAVERLESLGYDIEVRYGQDSLFFPRRSYTIYVSEICEPIPATAISGSIRAAGFYGSCPETIFSTIQHADGLEQVWIVNCGITPADLQALSNYPLLAEAFVRNEPLIDVPALKEFLHQTSLETIRLENAKLSDKNLDIQSSSVLKIHMTSCGITTLSWVEKFPKLERLIIDGASMSQVEAVRLPSNVRMLWLFNVDVLESSWTLQVPPRLQFLRLGGSKVRPENFRGLSSASRLQQVELGDVPAAADFLPVIPKDCWLTVLDLSGSTITSTSLEEVAKFASVDHLKLNRVEGLSDADFAILARVPGLNQIALIDSTFSHEGLRVLLQARPTLRVLLAPTADKELLRKLRAEFPAASFELTVE